MGVLDPPLECYIVLTKFAQVLQLSKVPGLQSAPLLKMNYFKGRFKLFE